MDVGSGIAPFSLRDIEPGCSMRHEDRQIGAEQDMTREAAENHLADTAMSVATHY